MLQNLARYVFRTGNPFGVGHHVPLNGPIALGADTEIHSVAFALDPELGEISTPFGAVEFLQMVGITRDEARAIKGNVTKVIGCPSKTRTEIAGAVEGAPWYSASLIGGSLVVERHDPQGKAREITRVATSASALKVKTFSMPKAKLPACPAGSFRAAGGCVKKCAEDSDCASDEFCEDIHDFSDGTIGPLLGRGCSK